jgi:hypothetical protein
MAGGRTNLNQTKGNNRDLMPGLKSFWRFTNLETSDTYDFWQIGQVKVAV